MALRSGRMHLRRRVARDQNLGVLRDEAMVVSAEVGVHELGPAEGAAFVLLMGARGAVAVHTNSVPGGR